MAESDSEDYHSLDISSSSQEKESCSDDEASGIDFGSAVTESSSAECSRTFKNIVVTVITDDITNQQVDVIINSTAKSLDLKEGAASRALVRKGGVSIQQECQRKYVNGISEGDIAVTGGGSLQCEQIYHTCLPPWDSGNNKMAPQKLLIKCLEEASKSKHTSVAFPALGTGNLNYERDVVAKTMFAGVEKFAMKNPSSSVVDVRFVVFPSDVATAQAFKAVANKGKGTDTSSRNVCSVDVKNLTVNIKVGQLYEQQSDVVMTTSTRGLDLTRGTLSNSVLEAAGPGLQTECASKYPKGIQHGEIAILGPANLSCKSVYCGALPRYDKPQDQGDPKQLLTKLVTTCLQQASSDGMASISFPTLGTGYLMYQPKVSASLMLKAISDFSTKNAGSALKTVNIVILSVTSSIEKNLQPFESECKLYKPKQPPALSSELLNKRQTRVEDKSEKSNIEVRESKKYPILRPRKPMPRKQVPFVSECDSYKSSQEEEPFKSEFKSQKSSPPAVAPKPNRQSKKIGGLIVQTNLEEVLKRVSQNPVPKPRRRVVSSDSAESLPERGTPEFCLHMYTSEICPPTNWTEFTSDKKVNQWKIEQRGKPVYRLIKVDPSTFDTIEKLVQQTWEPAKVGHGRDAAGLSDLDFNSLKITKIERIENLTVYEQYCQCRQQLFHKAGEGPMFKTLSNISTLQNGSSKVERYLDDSWKKELYEEVNEGYFFHGTKKDRVDGLLKQGLDPRMAQGGAVLGTAVYLAESSTKADQYTDDRNNLRQRTGLQMFLVKACLGSICLLKDVQKLRRPPCCEGCDDDGCCHENRHNSVVCEGKYIFREFVVYDSHQVYPEYVITYDRV